MGRKGVKMSSFSWDNNVLKCRLFHGMTRCYNVVFLPRRRWDWEPSCPARWTCSAPISPSHNFRQHILLTDWLFCYYACSQIGRIMSGCSSECLFWYYAFIWLAVFLLCLLSDWLDHERQLFWLAVLLLCLLSDWLDCERQLFWLAVLRHCLLSDWLFCYYTFLNIIGQ